jgi:D-xylose transport system substrate-binding protein
MKKIAVLMIIALLAVGMLFVGIGCKTIETAATTAAATTAAATTAAATTAAEATTAATTAQKQIRIGFSLPQSINVIFTESGRIMQELGKKDGVEVITQFANDDASLQKSQIENMLTQGIDALVICAVDMDAIKSSVDAAKADKIPVVSFSRGANNSDIDYMIRMSYDSVGFEAAKLAYSLYPKGNYGLINGDTADAVAHQKRAGVGNFLDPYVKDGSIKIVTDQWTVGWKVENALKIAEDALTANKNDIQAFVCANDSTALGALQAVEAQGLAGKIYINGEDCDIANAQAIVEGKITASFFAPIDLRVQKTYEVTMDLIKGTTLPKPTLVENNGFKDVPIIEVPAIAITKDNMYEKIIKIGFLKLEDVYKNIPKDQWPKG